MKTLISTVAVCALISLTLVQTADAAAGRVRVKGANGTAVATAGNDQAIVRGRRVVQNDDGSVTASSGAAYANRSGTRAARASTTTVNEDGSAEHQGGLAATGAKGSVESSGSSSRDADGNGSGSRSTTATSNATGNTYNGQTTYDRSTGVNHTQTCTDASGATITCPTR